MIDQTLFNLTLTKPKMLGKKEQREYKSKLLYFIETTKQSLILISYV
jgi:hypothetical protein